MPPATHPTASARPHPDAPTITAFAGDVAGAAFNAATPAEQQSLTEWAETISKADDAQFVDAAAELMSRYTLLDVWERRTPPHTLCKILLTHREADVRHLAAGHAVACPGPTLYDQAWARVARENAVTSDPLPPACTCTFGRLPVPTAPLTRMWK